MHTVQNWFTGKPPWTIFMFGPLVCANRLKEIVSTRSEAIDQRSGFQTNTAMHRI